MYQGYIMTKSFGPNQVQYDKTRALFLSIARKEFTKNGYAKASTNDIIEKAGMARGSLYYHFKDKQALFCAVYEDLLQDMLRHISAVIKAQPDPWQAYLSGCMKYLDLCLQDEVQVIHLREASAHLDYSSRQAIDSKTLIGAQRMALHNLIDHGVIRSADVGSLAVLVSGALYEAGKTLYASNNPQHTKRMLAAELMNMLSGMILKDTRTTHTTQRPALPEAFPKEAKA